MSRWCWQAAAEEAKRKEEEEERKEEKRKEQEAAAVSSRSTADRLINSTEIHRAATLTFTELQGLDLHRALVAL